MIVLGGGGILGEAWMAGLLAGLDEATGFDARRCRAFVGTSAGSIVAAGLAGGVDPRTRLESLPEQPAPAVASIARTPAQRRMPRVLRTGRDAAIAPLAGLALRSSAFGGAAVRRTALARVPEGRRSLGGLGKAIDSLGLEWDGRLLVTTVELETGRRVVFGSPEARHLSVARAVEASCAIPGVFRPIRADGRAYVDGGAWSLTNLDVAPVERGDHVLCLIPTGAMPSGMSLRGALGAFSRSVASVETLALQRRGATVTTLSPDADASGAMGANFMDPRRRRATQQAGFAQGLRAAGRLAGAA